MYGFRYRSHHKRFKKAEDGLNSAGQSSRIYVFKLGPLNSPTQSNKFILYLEVTDLSGPIILLCFIVSWLFVRDGVIEVVLNRY